MLTWVSSCGACVRAQEQGLDTVDANRALGLPDDCREYTSVRNILRDLAVRSVQLMVRGGWAREQAADRLRS
jgi:GTP cyclohydrolase II